MNNREHLDAITQHVDAIRASLPPDVPPQTPTITTSQGLTDAAAVGGGQYLLGPGDYTGNFIFGLPIELIELMPGTVRLLAGDPFQPTLHVTGSQVRIEGFTIPSARDDREPVLVGSYTATDPNTLPDDVTFIGTKLIATATGGKRGFSLHARKTSLINCEATGYFRAGQDSQAVWINNGPGPYLIDGGHYEASGENILLGGDGLPCGVNPSAIIRNLRLSKPQSWRGKGYTVKNLFEVKAGVDVTLENCDLDGCWAGGQAGSPIVITTVDQTRKSTWTQVDRVKILNNRVVNCPDGFGVNINGRDAWTPTLPMVDVRVIGNYFADGAGGIQIGDAAALNLAVVDNTFRGVSSKFLSFYGSALVNLVFVRNVVRSGSYGIVGDDNKAAGLPALIASVVSYLVEENVIEQSARWPLTFPPNNRIIPPGGLDALLDAQGKMLDGSAGY